MTVLQSILTGLVIIYCIILNNIQSQTWKKKEFVSWLFYTVIEAVAIVFAILVIQG